MQVPCKKIISDAVCVLLNVPGVISTNVAANVICTFLPYRSCV